MATPVSKDRHRDQALRELGATTAPAHIELPRADRRLPPRQGTPTYRQPAGWDEPDWGLRRRENSRAGRALFVLLILNCSVWTLNLGFVMSLQ